MPTPLKPVVPATAADMVGRLVALVSRGPGSVYRRDLDALRWLLGEYDRLTRGLDPDPFPAAKERTP